MNLSPIIGVGVVEGEKCCCGKVHVEAPKPAPKKVNNLMVRNSEYCCGLVELGNFNYVDPPGGKKMTHYHKGANGVWNTQKNQEPTTREDILSKIKESYSAGVICTTGAGQEYLEPVLEGLGFVRASSFINPGHANTPVVLWCLDRKNLKEG